MVLTNTDFYEHMCVF